MVVAVEAVVVVTVVVTDVQFVPKWKIIVNLCLTFFADLVLVPRVWNWALRPRPAVLRDETLSGQNWPIRTYRLLEHVFLGCLLPVNVSKLTCFYPLIFRICHVSENSVFYSKTWFRCAFWQLSTRKILPVQSSNQKPRANAKTKMETVSGKQFCSEILSL